MGFTVIVHNLRGHGSAGSSATSGRTTWGWEYPYDLLGAWDYAVEDPENLMGGPISPQKVGCLGESMGAFICATAFGMEHRMGGAWMDSSIYNPYHVDFAAPIIRQTLHMKTQPGRMGAAWSAVTTRLLAWFQEWWAWRLTGVDLAYNCPNKTIPTGPDIERKVAVFASMIDDFVPVEDSFRLVGLLGGYPDKYRVVTSMFPAVVCNGNAHTENVFYMPQTYRSELCRYWSIVNGRSESLCGIEKLPNLTIQHRDKRATEPYEFNFRGSADRAEEII